MAKTNEIRPIGEYDPITGTKQANRLSGTGRQVVFGGKGDDKLTGFNAFDQYGITKIAPILSGGSGSDAYIVRSNSFSIIADAGGKGVDVIQADAIHLDRCSFWLMNGRDLYMSDGSTSLLIYDVFGVESRSNTIERLVFKKGSYQESNLPGSADAAAQDASSQGRTVPILYETGSSSSAAPVESPEQQGVTANGPAVPVKAFAKISFTRAELYNYVMSSDRYKGSLPYNALEDVYDYAIKAIRFGDDSFYPSDPYTGSYYRVVSGGGVTDEFVSLRERGGETFVIGKGQDLVETLANGTKVTTEQPDKLYKIEEVVPGSGRYKIVETGVILDLVPVPPAELVRPEDLYAPRKEVLEQFLTGNQFSGFSLSAMGLDPLAMGSYVQDLAFNNGLF